MESNNLDLLNSSNELNDLIEQMNRDIQEKDRKITIRECYDTLGIKCSNKYPDAFIDCYGWDKKGFRQLY